ncbi:hypothetical protein AOLI_G00100890 [Acnodon oligacanthus]
MSWTDGAELDRCSSTFMSARLCIDYKTTPQAEEFQQTAPAKQRPAHLLSFSSAAASDPSALWMPLVSGHDRRKPCMVKSAGGLGPGGRMESQCLLLNWPQCRGAAAQRPIQTLRDSARGKSGGKSWSGFSGMALLRRRVGTSEQRVEQWLRCVGSEAILLAFSFIVNVLYGWEDRVFTTLHRAFLSAAVELP